MSLALLLLLQTTAREPIFVPPPPPAPKSGLLECKMRDESDAASDLSGELGFSTDNVDGKLHPRVLFKSASVAELNGLFWVAWGSSNGKMTLLSGDSDLSVTADFVGPTYTSEKGALAVQIWRYSTREKKYLSGICVTSFSLKGGKTFQ